MPDIDLEPGEKPKAKPVETIPSLLAKMVAGLMMGIAYWWFRTHH